MFLVLLTVSNKVALDGYRVDKPTLLPIKNSSLFKPKPVRILKFTF